VRIGDTFSSPAEVQEGDIFVVMDSPMPRPTSFQAPDDNLGQRSAGTPTFPQPLINRPGIRGDTPLSRKV
jgi:hypothetical protein